MINFSLREVEAVTRIGSLAQECINEESFGEIITKELLSLLNSVSGVFIDLEQSADGIALHSGSSYVADHRHMKPYIDYYHRLDPVLVHYRNNHKSPAAIATTEEAVRDKKMYVESEFYQDFLRQTGVCQAMIFGLSADAHPFGLVGLHREKPQGVYSSKDRAIIRLVTPYLSLALQFRQERRKQLQNDRVISKLLTHSRIRGYLVLDRAFVLQGYAGKLDGLSASSLETDILRELGSDVFQCLEHKLKQMLLYMRKHHDRTSHSAPGDIPASPLGRSLQVETIRHDGGSTQFLCLDIAGSNALLSTQRIHACNLTPRQIDVAKLVALGMTNSAIAQAMGISPKTVENYLGAIYGKTGATNKASLIALLAN
ncbi:MAG: helix-turn-helix transcriptional regulator [Gammaproteobacteria bacterium]|nr:helix-turn-helix transcriptional regulator [Gammaproteobacteria bacterium]MCY4211533.1 helix-turn-helix transcriptional regulator [Gammaproteobacteria bacterium]MCY4283681.1 helix-turn-helix transcriptional regulator [Gammaproteobacteria bacterium]MCY4339140.1 helix-turn-helix transcriptional regulator [Gammaproteobacteria bacterium]